MGPMGSMRFRRKFVVLMRKQSNATSYLVIQFSPRPFAGDFDFDFGVDDQRIRRNAAHEKDIAADGAARADHGFAAKNRSTGINRHIILNGRMAFVSA